MTTHTRHTELWHRIRHVPRLAAAALGVCIALLLAACGGNGDDDEEPGTAPSEAPESGKTEPSQSRAQFQVTINGFTARTATWDHALNVDGWGDEVYVSVPMALKDESGIILETTTSSAVIGHTRDQVGRVACGSHVAGGIKDGDACMTTTPWAITSDITADRPPMEIANVELVEGETQLVLSPTIWEWDGGRDAYADWVTWLKNSADKIPAGVGDSIVTAGKLGLDIALSLSDPLGQAADRPIGITEQAAGEFKFDPKIMVLDYDKAMILAESNLGKGKGVITLNYKDAAKFHGDYDLYIQIRKL